MKLLCVMALLLAQATPQAPAAPHTISAPRDAHVPAPLNDARFTNVALRIDGSDELRAAHRGYWAALQARPEWLQQEAVWWQLMQTPDLGPLLVQVDEALQRQAQSQALYDQFYARLAQDENLRRSVEQFERAGFTQRGDIRQWQAALNFLRANPTAALPLLDGVAEEEPLPEALRPFATELMNPRAWQALRGPLESLGQNPATAEALEPWWNSIAALDAESNGAFNSLALHFAQHPQRFWAVYRRELALAKEPQLRDWVRWWHRRLRREKLDYPTYLAWLGAMKDGSESPAQSNPGDWPPAAPAPAVDAVPKEALPKPQGAAERKQQQGIVRPEVPLPQKPVRPERPQMRQSDLMKDRVRAK